MGWLSSLPAAITVGEDRYIERRTDPDDSTKEQYRKRETLVKEYRGVDFATAEAALVGYPLVSSGDSTNTRSLQAIGGGGYIVIEIKDQPTTSWLDFSTTITIG